MSRNRLFEALSETETLDKILSFENTHFENNINGVNQATVQLTNIFENLANRACKTIKFRKKKPRKKKLWVDSEVRDLKKTVLDSGHKLQLQPFNGQLKLAFFKHSKELKKNGQKEKVFTSESYI